LFQARENEKAFDLLDPEIEFIVGPAAIPGIDRIYRGHDGVRKFWRTWLEAWGDMEWTSELETLADGRVRAVITQRNKSRTGEVWVQQPPYEQVWTVENGKATRMVLSRG
jgi:hypothetical protein